MLDAYRAARATNKAAAGERSKRITSGPGPSWGIRGQPSVFPATRLKSHFLLIQSCTSHQFNVSCKQLLNMSERRGLERAARTRTVRAGALHRSCKKCAPRSYKRDYSVAVCFLTCPVFFLSLSLYF